MFPVSDLEQVFESSSPTPLENIPKYWTYSLFLEGGMSLSITS